MNVTVNGDSKEVSRGLSLRALIEELGFSERKGMAIAVNQSVVPNGKWSDWMLSESDSILVIQATQGG